LFAGEVERRTANIIGDRSVDDRLRIDRLSYMLGGKEFSAYRFEGGRFYSIYLPEIGLIDGAEGVWHLPHGFRLGAGVGSYPRPFPSNDFAEDIGFHVFANYQSEQEHHLSALVAYQKTWHNGLSVSIMSRSLSVTRSGQKRLQSNCQRPLCWSATAPMKNCYAKKA